MGAQRDEPHAVLEIQNVEDEPEQEHAGQCRPDRADATRQQRAADHDRCDGEELPADALRRLAGAELGRELNAGEPRHEAAQRVDRELHPIDRKTHQPRRVLAAADGQDVAAEGPEVQDDRSDDVGEQRDPGRVSESQAGRPGRSR